MTDAPTVLNDLKNRIAFIDEDLILISLMNNFEVLFQVSSCRIINQFNKMNAYFNFNEEFLSREFINVQKNNMMVEREQKHSKIHR